MKLCNWVSQSSGGTIPFVLVILLSVISRQKLDVRFELMLMDHIFGNLGFLSDWLIWLGPPHPKPWTGNWQIVQYVLNNGDGLVCHSLGVS